MEPIKGNPIVGYVPPPPPPDPNEERYGIPDRITPPKPWPTPIPSAMPPPKTWERLGFESSPGPWPEIVLFFLLMSLFMAVLYVKPNPQPAPPPAPLPAPLPVIKMGEPENNDALRKALLKNEPKAEFVDPETPIEAEVEF